MHHLGVRLRNLVSILAAAFLVVGTVPPRPALATPSNTSHDYDPEPEERTPEYAQPPASASEFTATAQELAAAMDIAPGDLVYASLGTSDPLATSVGTQLSYFPTKNSSFAILATGLASSAATANSSGSLSYHLAGQNNVQGNDMVQLTLSLRVPAGQTCLSFDFAYYSEEFPEFVGSNFNDTFTAQHDSSSQSIVGNEVYAQNNFAYDGLGNVVSVNTVTGVSGNTGTTYDGRTALLQAHTQVIPSQTVTLVFTVQDLGDSIYDSAVFLDNLRWSVNSNCSGGSQRRQPILLVHGFQGRSQTSLNCSPQTASSDVLFYAGPTNPTPDHVDYWEDLPAWLNTDFDVWVAELTTGKVQGTPAIEVNAGCLREQVKHVALMYPGQKLILIAHSMGGLVSRACLSYVECAGHVKALYTLGSPHAGLPIAYYDYAKNLGNCEDATGQTAVCQMSIPWMKDHFNPSFKNIGNVHYTFIGGDFYKHATVPYPSSGEHDGLVGSNSSVGWMSNGTFDPSWQIASVPHQYWTDEVHSRAFAKNIFGQHVYNSYYQYRMQAPDSGDKSYAYQCLLVLLAGGSLPGFCRLADSAASAQAGVGEPQRTAAVTGHLTSGQSSTQSLDVSSASTALFGVSWTEGQLGFTLTRPDAQVIDPAYAGAHPEEVVYEEHPGGPEQAPSASYSFPNGVLPGAWQVHVSAVSVPASGTDFAAQAYLTSNLVLTATTNTDIYAAGQSATLTAHLSDSGTGLAGATLIAQVVRPDGITETVPLLDQGGGYYSAMYDISTAPGFMNLEFVAAGTTGGQNFSRSVLTLAAVTPGGVSFSGSATAQPQNANGDLLYEHLDFTLPISVAIPGSYTLLADLVAGPNLVAQSAVDVNVGTGIQFVTLRFDGNTIRAAQIDGPYSLTNVQLVAPNYGIPAANQQNVATTAAYGWQAFGGCFSLTVGANPSPGGTILVAPARNCNAGTQYSNGTLIQLTAKANLGYRFADWIVDLSGMINPASLIMDEDMVVKANFAANRVFLPTVLRGGSSTAFDSSFNGDALGWSGVVGVWQLSPQFYYTSGSAGLVASTARTDSFANFDYSARVFRYGCATCANRLIIRGTPNPLGGDGSWSRQYIFQYGRTGMYSVWKTVNGVHTPLQPWTTHAAVLPGDAWNVLRVVANNGNLYYYINSTLVWSGLDASLTSGQVGIGMYRDTTSTGNFFYVDWAMLTPLAAMDAAALPAVAELANMGEDDVGSVNLAPEQ